jgi:hypothetical protein
VLFPQVPEVSKVDNPFAFFVFSLSLDPSDLNPPAVATHHTELTDIFTQYSRIEFGTGMDEWEWDGMGRGGIPHRAEEEK